MIIDELDKYILQTKTDSLKTKEYIKEYSDLVVKVSFGMSKLSNVPWMAFRPPNISVSNGYYPVYVYYKKQNILILAYGISDTVKQDEHWPKEIIDNKTKIKDFFENPYRYGDSYVFKHYYPKIDGNKVIYMRDEKEISSTNMNKELDEIVDYFKDCIEIKVKDESSSISKGLFYMEKQLEDFIIENWDETDLSNKYDLIFDDDGELVSQQYRTDIGLIDILVKDKKSKNYVVIELKKNQTSDDTVGQITRYMGWIKEHLKDDKVKGIIISGHADKKLSYALSMVNNIDIFLYEVNFNLKEWESN